MPLIINKSETYFWPVEIRIAKDGGKYDTGRFDAEYRRLKQSELDEMQQLVREEKLNDVDVVNRILVGWKGVLDANNEEIPYSETNRGVLLDAYPGMRVSILKAFFESVSGGVRKN